MIRPSTRLLFGTAIVGAALAAALLWWPEEPAVPPPGLRRRPHHPRWCRPNCPLPNCLRSALRSSSLLRRRFSTRCSPTCSAAASTSKGLPSPVAPRTPGARLRVRAAAPRDHAVAGGGRGAKAENTLYRNYKWGPAAFRGARPDGCQPGALQFKVAPLAADRPWRITPA